MPQVIIRVSIRVVIHPLFVAREESLRENESAEYKVMEIAESLPALQKHLNILSNINVYQYSIWSNYNIFQLQYPPEYLEPREVATSSPGDDQGPHCP